MKRKIRWVFIFVLLMFAVELMVSLKYKQPYPAIIYPSFGDIPNVSRPIRKADLKVFFNNQDSLDVNTADFFFHLPNIFDFTILTRNFTEQNSFLRSSKKLKPADSTIASSQQQSDRAGIKKNKKTENGIAWIKSRLSEMTGRTDLERFEVQWHKYLFDGENHHLSDTLVEKFKVDLK